MMHTHEHRMRHEAPAGKKLLMVRQIQMHSLVSVTYCAALAITYIMFVQWHAYTHNHFLSFWATDTCPCLWDGKIVLFWCNSKLNKHTANLSQNANAWFAKLLPPICFWLDWMCLSLLSHLVCSWFLLSNLFIHYLNE